MLKCWNDRVLKTNNSNGAKRRQKFKQLFPCSCPEYPVKSRFAGPRGKYLLEPIELLDRSLCSQEQGRRPV